MDRIKRKIEALIRDAEQTHAEAIVEGLLIAELLEDVLEDLYWAYKEACEFDE